MSESKRVVIIGGGIVGLCSAYYTALKGHVVTVLDGEGRDHRGCSYGNAGMIVPSHFVPLAAPGMVSLGLRMMLNPESPFWIRPRLSRELLSWAGHFIRSANAANVARAAPLLRDLHLASRARYEELASLPDADFGLVKKGLLMLCETDRTFREESHLAETARSIGLPGEVLTAQETKNLEPGIRMEIAGAVYYPQDCYLVPDRAMRTLISLAESAGVKICWNRPVNGFRGSNGRIDAALTREGEITGDEFVIAGGSWSSSIARSVGIRLPMQAGKGYSLTLQNPRQLPTVCGILVEGRVAVTPMDGALRFAGTMEIAGQETTRNPRRVRGIIRSVCRSFPEFQPGDFEGVEAWCGLRPCSPDGLPYIGRFRRFANLSAATGHAMMGLSLGPVTGHLVSQIVSDEKPELAIEALSPDRFGG